MRKEIADFWFESCIFISGEAALLGQAFYGLLDSAMSCLLPNLLLVFFGGGI